MYGGTVLDPASNKYFLEWMKDSPKLNLNRGKTRENVANNRGKEEAKTLHSDVVEQEDQRASKCLHQNQFFFFQAIRRELTVGLRKPFHQTLPLTESRTTAEPTLSALILTAQRAFSSSVNQDATSGLSHSRRQNVGWWTNGCLPVGHDEVGSDTNDHGECSFDQEQVGPDVVSTWSWNLEQTKEARHERAEFATEEAADLR